jgi:hypothetical protein
VNPRNKYNGNETQPIKYAVGQYLGDNGVMVYDVISITLGINNIPKADKLIDLVGVFGTIEEANVFLNEKNSSSTESNNENQDTVNE